MVKNNNHGENEFDSLFILVKCDISRKNFGEFHYASQMESFYYASQIESFYYASQIDSKKFSFGFLWIWSLEKGIRTLFSGE